MKKLILTTLIIIGFASSINATITGTDRGTGNHNSASGTLTCTPTSNFTAGSFGVLVIAMDNSGSAGNTPIAPATASGSDGSTWTRRLDAVFDNGAASAGAEIVIFTSNTTSLTTGQSVTVTWTATTPTAKAYGFHEFTTNAAGKIIQFIAGSASNTAGGTTGTPTSPATNVNNGNVFIGGGAAESANTWTGDADTSNGNSSTQRTNAAGSGTTGMSLTTQRKIVSATANQTYNPTLTSVDVILGWIQLPEVSAFMPRRMVIM